jgi:hypothetical protein
MMAKYCASHIDVVTRLNDIGTGLLIAAVFVAIVLKFTR